MTNKRLTQLAKLCRSNGLSRAEGLELIAEVRELRGYLRDFITAVRDAANEEAVTTPKFFGQRPQLTPDEKAGVDKIVAHLTRSSL